VHVLLLLNNNNSASLNVIEFKACCFKVNPCTELSTYGPEGLCNA